MYICIYKYIYIFVFIYVENELDCVVSTEVNEASLVKWQNQAVYDTVWACVFALCELQNILVGLI